MLDSLPLFPLGTVLFPGMVLPLRIFEQRYRDMFAARSELDPIFGVVLTRSGREVGDRPEIHQVGTGASLLEAVRYSDGRVDLAVQGDRRFRVLDGHWEKGYLTASVAWLPDGASDASAAGLADRVQRAFHAYLDALRLPAGLRIDRPDFGNDPVTMAYAMCSLMPFDTAQRQRLLEAEPPVQLLRDLLAMLRRERELLVATGIGGAALNYPGRGFSTN